MLEGRCQVTQRQERLRCHVAARSQLPKLSLAPPVDPAAKCGGGDYGTVAGARTDWDRFLISDPVACKQGDDAVVTYGSCHRGRLAPHMPSSPPLALFDRISIQLHATPLADTVSFHGWVLRYKKYSFLPPLEGGTCLSSSFTALNSLKFGCMSSPISHTDAMLPHL